MEFPVSNIALITNNYSSVERDISAVYPTYWKITDAQKNSLHYFYIRRMGYWKLIDQLLVYGGKLRHRDVIYEVILMGRSKETQREQRSVSGKKPCGTFIVQFRQAVTPTGVVAVAFILEAFLPE